MKKFVRTLVVDDEAPARAALCHLLSEDPEVEIVGACANGQEALEALRTQTVDLVFLDVRMPGLDGFEVLRAAQQTPKVVFVTAFVDYAVEAFDIEAVDYLLKPFDDERFARALGRAKTALMTVGTANAGRLERHQSPYLERLLIPSREGAQVLNVSEIDWFEAQDYYVEVHVGKRGYLLRKSLRRLEQGLDPSCFVRIHRSAIVNVAQIRYLETATHGERELVLRDGTRLHLSRVYRKRLNGLSLKK